MRTLTIHHPDTRDDPYEIHDLGESGPGSLGEAIRCEAEIVASDHHDGRPPTEIEHAVFQAAYRQLLHSGEYVDPLGVRWTLETWR